MQHPLCQTVMAVIREQRKLYAKVTGIAHHIDHIVPLCRGGDNATWNMRAIPADMNLARDR
jgi:hypothetical protein